MLVKEVTFKDYNGDTVTEKFHFHLSEAELVEMDHSEEGGLKEKLDRIIAENDRNEIIRHFKEILLAAYGEKSPDGKRFIKTDETRQNLEFSPAYSILFMELLGDDKKAVKFIDAILPADLRAKSNADDNSKE